MEEFRLKRGANDLVYDDKGREFVDLFSGHGAVFLGHNDEDVRRAVATQLEELWIAGGIRTPALDRAKASIEQYFPSSHQVAGLYSTGMEAAEFAMRAARAATGRTGLVGFEGDMHGKSMATAYLGWDNHDGIELPGFVRLPFVSTTSEEEILARLEEALVGRTIAAVFIEPMQGCAGGFEASTSFHEDVSRLCKRTGTLLVFDEILTGFYRTGTLFAFMRLGVVPDMILIGKAMGNGFPVSAVVMDRSYPLVSRMLPGSTFAGNPLASAATSATLDKMRTMNLEVSVGGIEETIGRALSELGTTGTIVRGRGAAWFLDLPSSLIPGRVVEEIYKAGVVVGVAGKILRIMPAATIDLDRLARACRLIADKIIKG